MPPSRSPGWEVDRIRALKKSALCSSVSLKPSIVSALRARQSSPKLDGSKPCSSCDMELRGRCRRSDSHIPIGIQRKWSKPTRSGIIMPDQLVFERLAVGYHPNLVRRFIRSNSHARVIYAVPRSIDIQHRSSSGVLNMKFAVWGTPRSDRYITSEWTNEEIFCSGYCH